jgi:phasin family protein
MRMMLRCNIFWPVGFAKQIFLNHLEKSMPASLTAQQFATANKNAFAEAQVLVSAAFFGFEKLVELNMATAKSSLFQTGGDFLSSLSANNPSDALAAQASLAKPMAEQAIAYAKSVYAIVTETSGVLTKATEEKFTEGQKAVAAVIDNIADNAPAGSESMVALIKSAVAAGQNAIDTAKSTAKKVVELAEQQAATLSASALSSVKTNGSLRRK